MMTETEEKQQQVITTDDTSDKYDRFDTLGSIFDLRISVWNGKINDRALAKKVAKDNDASPEILITTKNLMTRSNETLKRVLAAASKIKRIHKKYSLPWTLDGSGIVPNPYLFPLREEIHPAIDEFDTAADDFVVHYPDLIQKNLDCGGTLLTADEYPSPDTIRSRYKVRLIGPLPLPRGKNLVLNGLENAILAREQINTENQINEVLANSYKSLYRRVMEPIKKMYEKLRSYSKTDDGVEGKFHDSLIYNVEDMLDLIEAFNITDDPELNLFAIEIQKNLCRYDPEVLRDDAQLRNNVADKAEEIFNRMSYYL